MLLLMQRRQFLASPIVFKLAAAAPAASWAAASSDSVRMGIIGVGIRGTQLMQAFMAVPGVKFIAAADLYDGYLTSVGERVPGIAVSKDYRAVLDNKDVDAVIIATPDHWHLKMAIDALAAGKHVYLEKPMAWSIEQCRSIYLESSKRPKQMLQTGSGAGASALTLAARDLIASGALGKVNQVRMENHRNSPQGAWVYPIPPDASPQTIDWARFIGPSPKKAFDPKIFFRWRCWWEYSGGVATDLFVHQLTQLHSLMMVEGPKSVVAQGGLFRWDDGRSVPDLMQAVYEYPGFLTTLHVNLGNVKGTGQTTVIHGSEGTLIFEGRGKLTYYPEQVEPDVQPYGTLAWPKAMRAKYFESHGWSADGKPGSRPEPRPAREVTVERQPTPQEQFIASVREGKPVCEPAFAGYAAASSAHLANLAYKRGKRMSLDLKTGKVS
jgi:predicted dehydrogenase